MVGFGMEDIVERSDRSAVSGRTVVFLIKPSACVRGCKKKSALIAQLVERTAVNRKVVGSNPTGSVCFVVFFRFVGLLAFPVICVWY